MENIQVALWTQYKSLVVGRRETREEGKKNNNIGSLYWKGSLLNLIQHESK